MHGLPFSFTFLTLKRAKKEEEEMVHNWSVFQMFGNVRFDF